MNKIFLEYFYNKIKPESTSVAAKDKCHVKKKNKKKRKFIRNQKLFYEHIKQIFTKKYISFV